MSDLHLFTNRTRTDHHLDDFMERAANSDVFILNGDVFDFQWSEHRENLASAHAAKDWLERFIKDHPHCTFIILLGNHDSAAEYQVILDELQNERENVWWFAEYCRIGNRIFMHGDVYHSGITSEALHADREKRNQTLNSNRFLEGMYWFSAWSRLQKLLFKMVRRKTCARRMSSYLANALGISWLEITDIYFGHVHTPFTDFEWEGRLYHNTGACMLGLKHEPLHFQTTDHELKNLKGI